MRNATLCVGLRASLVPLALVLVAGCKSSLAEPARPVRWSDWSPEVFERARREERLVLLNLGAVWCHWCHVMEHETYGNPAVQALIAEGFVAVKVDQDARPDLASRYEDYGWPATILFDSEQHELGKFRGFIEPERMASVLRAFRADPTPGPSVQLEPAPSFAGGAALGAELRAELEERRRAGYDDEHGGWGRVHKFVEPGNVEYALLLARGGDEREEHMARETLERGLALVDPVWGGVYQYSHGGVWENPHFEKIMSFQADDLRIYSLAWLQWQDERFLDAAAAVSRFLATLLTSPEGAFYASQDADLVKGEHAQDYFALDDAGRRALGLPAIDVNVYARENGWAIDALCCYHAACDDDLVLERAVRAARFVIAERALAGGGFRHGERDEGGPFLADTLAMGRAFTSLYAATGEREWLERASAAAGFIERTFRPLEAQVPGYLTARPAPGASGPFAPVPQYDENVDLARWLNLQSRYSGRALERDMAGTAMAWLASPEMARTKSVSTGSLLLADLELESDPLHVTVVGPLGDADARDLFRAARALPASYKRVEWLDASAGELPNPDVAFPALARPAAFVCADGACSSPIYDAAGVPRAAARRAR